MTDADLLGGALAPPWAHFGGGRQQKAPRGLRQAMQLTSLACLAIKADASSPPLKGASMPPRRLPLVPRRHRRRASFMKVLGTGSMGTVWLVADEEGELRGSSLTKEDASTLPPADVAGWRAARWRLRTLDAP